MGETFLTKEQIVATTEAMGIRYRMLYAVITTPTRGYEEIKANITEHIAYQMELEKNGILFAAGPFFKENSELCDGTGLIVLRAESLDHAKQIAAADPMHKSGARTFTIRPWLMTEGSISVKINFSNQTFDLLSEK